MYATPQRIAPGSGDFSEATPLEALTKFCEVLNRQTHKETGHMRYEQLLELLSASLAHQFHE
jgi:hypothetical protein